MLEQQGFSPAWQPVEKLPLQRSDLGLASFVQAFVFAGMVIAALVIAFAMVGFSGRMNADSPIAIVMGMTMLGGMGVGFSGFGLGVAALFQKGRQRTFAILGIVLNGMGLFIMLGLVALGCLVD